ncbi:hypothetical protein [Pseudonocardia sp. NPDC046786]|uniref:hypothetical protein n=1 Tax=Pseudonocardia sp. NPDC046786 TaxID=3155471 RepID=UPI0033D31E55
MGTAERTPTAGHELLLQLAGRVPDELLWRMRNWLAGGDSNALSATLPRTLLRHRIGITDDERALLAEVVVPGSPSRRLVDAVLPGSAAPPPAFGPGAADLAAWSAMSVVSSADGGELLIAARDDGARLLLVRGAERPVELTATLQRLLRVHGEHVPRVEVWVDDDPPTAYHRAACAAAVSLWSRSPVPTG